MSERELDPDKAPPADLPRHARERLAEMKKKHFFTSDLTVNEFLLTKQMGFDPLGLVMGSSIYQIAPQIPRWDPFGTSVGEELTGLTQALYHARELAMSRMEEEADALGADGIIGVRLKLDLHAWGQQVAEFVAVGTAVKSAGGHGVDFRTAHGKPFTSDLSGQDFWTLLKSGYRPMGFVMGNCVYYVPPGLVLGSAGSQRNAELPVYTHAFYDARELAIERLQSEAEDLGATGIVGVHVQEEEYEWQGALQRSTTGQQTRFYGEILEFFVIGTAVAKMPGEVELPRPKLVISANT